MLEYIITGLIGAGMGLLGTYVGIKLMLKPEIILDFSDVLLDEVSKNAEFQKRIYVLGALLGQGVKSGVGLPLGRGKMKMEDIIVGAIGQFLSGGFGKKKADTPNAAPGLNTTIPQHLRE